MNYKLIFGTVLKVVKALAVLMLIPLLTSIIYNEKTAFLSFLVVIIASYLIAFIIGKFLKPTSKEFYSKDGFITVALTWIAVSLVGCLPFFISGEIPSFIDAWFETVSGFTTTGASVLQDVESLSKSMLLWRSFTHFIGGMGVLVFIMAITSKTTDRPINILKAEMPGPIVSKLVPRSKDTAKILYLIYCGLTLLLIVFLLFGDMNLFESIVHALATAGTGGFGVKNNSMVGYSSYTQWVLAIFMLLFGVNFNLFYLLLIAKAGTALKSTELKTYLIIIASAVIVICINIYPLYLNFYEALTASVFQTTSIITTTGYASADFNTWPTLSKIILFALMFIGGCSGSTAGGIKISRIVILTKKIRLNLKKLIHPNSVSVIKFEGEKVDDNVSNEISNYIALYASCFFAFLILVALNGFSFETTISSVAACFNNIGPGFGGVGPMANYAEFNGFSKIILSLAMLMGRLEIYPLLLALTPSTWIKK